MTKRVSFFASAVVAGVCSIGAWALSDDKAAPAAGHGDHAAKPAEGTAGGMDPAMMERWGKYMTPGAHHKGLEAMAGTFKYTNKFRMTPEAPWMESEGESTSEMALGGRYLMTTAKGPMMGEMFEGMGCMGYDNNSGKHFMAWIDNMGTGMMRAEGTCDGACKVLTFEGRQDDPMTGKKDQPYKITYEIKSNDEFSMHFWSPDESGNMFENMTIDYTRAK